ncbi:ATP-binding protein [Streptomyces sp. 4F14]|uniref:sensor histidine kinase n=1 Tax=Streptomyces sp. 4F14 TaxID=3394380 RepID=UPI003A8C55BD
MPGIRDRRNRNRSATRSPRLRSSFVVPFVVPAVCLTCLWGSTAAHAADEQSHADADRVTTHSLSLAGLDAPAVLLGSTAGERLVLPEPSASRISGISDMSRTGTPEDHALTEEYRALRADLAQAAETHTVPATFRQDTADVTATPVDLAAVIGVRADALLIGALTGAVAALAPVLAAWLVARRRKRAAANELRDLHAYAEEIAGRRLPEVLARIEKGERVDPGSALGLGTRRRGSEEIARLAAVIDRVALVSADTAIRQHMGREGTEKVVAQLIRRTQILLHRLIALLDDLERKHEDSDLLHDIFKVDHLATRARRHAENLMILSGTPTGRRTNAAVPITDVMRASVAETEAYTRVKVKNAPADRRTALAARAVSDVTHLLAELIENGTSFSPPETQVAVSAVRVAKGLAIHVEDHGLGIPPAQRHQANQLLANPPRLDLTALGEDPRLGHFVVAKLAERHGIKVELRESVYGGTLSIVLVPVDLLEEVGSPVLDQLQAAAAATMDAALPGAERAGIAGADQAPAGVEQVLVGAGALTSTGFDLPTHSRLADYDGFPEYAGAGLLPPVAGHPEPQQPYGYQQPAYEAPPAEPVASYDSASYDNASSQTYGSGLAAPQDPAAYQATYEPYPPQAPGPYGPGDTGLYAEQAVSPSYQEPPQAPFSPEYGYDTAANPAAEQYQQQTRPTTPPAAAPMTGNSPLTTPDVLPRRTRGAALAQQLRKEAAQFGEGGEPDESVISPDASARALSAIQRGLKRAQSPETEPLPPGPYDDEGP